MDILLTFNGPEAMTGQRAKSQTKLLAAVIIINTVDDTV